MFAARSELPEAFDTASARHETVLRLRAAFRSSAEAEAGRRALH